MILSHHPAASAEVLETVAWHAEQGGTQLADEFLAELDAAIRLLGLHPALGASTVAGRRAFRLARLPYTVVYRVKLSAIRVLAVAHQSRRPGYWRSRRRRRPTAERRWSLPRSVARRLCRRRPRHVVHEPRRDQLQP